MMREARALPHETNLLLAIEGALFQRGAKAEKHLGRLRMLVREEITPGADPVWRLLQGAADAYLAVLGVPNHPLRLEVVRMLKASLELAHRVPSGSSWRPKYTGGALRHFEREAER